MPPVQTIVFSAIAFFGMIYCIRVLQSLTLKDLFWGLFGVTGLLYWRIFLNNFLSFPFYAVYNWIMKNILKNPLSNLFSEHTYTFYVMPLDLDILLHMNNSRYSFNSDFARHNIYLKCGLMEHFQFRRYPVMSSKVTRYRASLELFQKVTVKTKLVYWDEKNIYFEQQQLANKKGDPEFVCAISFERVTLRNLTSAQLFDLLLANNKNLKIPTKPELTEELQHFIEFNSLSSERLRPNPSFEVKNKDRID